MKPTGIPTVEQMLANGDWADESFRKRIMAKPKLVASMATPELGRIVELMKEVIMHCDYHRHIVIRRNHCGLVHLNVCIHGYITTLSSPIGLGRYIEYLQALPLRSLVLSFVIIS